jgi:hypothetical protein
MMASPRASQVAAGTVCLAALVLVVLSVSRQRGAPAPGALLGQLPARPVRAAAVQGALPLALGRLKELKALPLLKAVSPLRAGVSDHGQAGSSRLQELAGRGASRTQSVAAAKAKAACDAECEKEGKERMKALRAEIDNDFNGMINFGESSAYVPPVESIEQQVKDGSLYGSKKEDDVKAPPSQFAGGALIAQDPGSNAPVISADEVQVVAKDVAAETPSADDLLKGIQQQEEQARNDVKEHVEPKISAGADDPILGHKSKGLPAGVTFGNEVQVAPPPPPAAPAPAEPVAAAAAAIAPAPVPSAPAAAAAGGEAPAPAPAAYPVAVQAEHSANRAAESHVAAVGAPAPVKAAVAAIAPVEQPPAGADHKSVYPLQHQQERGEVAETAAQPVPVHKSRGVLDNFPHVGPAFNDEAEGSAASPAAADESGGENKEWDKAFAFIHQTDNPLVGKPQGNGQENDLHSPGVEAAAATSGSPLDDDGFLKGFWGGD